MKKVLFFSSIVALFMGCSQNVVDGVDTTQKIAFNNLRAKANSAITRADETKAGANDDQDNYKVYASYSLDDTNWYFAEEVYGKNEGEHKMNEIVSGHAYYWLTGDVSYNFYAYAPASLEPTNKTLGNLVIDYTVPAKANEDFTVATPVTNRKYSKDNQTVDLVFYHALAKIVVEVKLSDDLKGSGYKLNWTNSDLTVNYDKGNMNINPLTDLSEVNQGWDNNQQSSKGMNKITYSGLKTFMVMPQTVENCSLQLKGVSITSKDDVKVFPSSKEEKTKDLKVLTFGKELIKGVSTFDQGKVYKLTFTINDLSTDKDDDLIFGKQILFNATHADWTATNVPVVQP